MKLEELYQMHQEEKENLYQIYQTLSQEEVEFLIEQWIETQDMEEERRDVLQHLAFYSYACGEYLPERLYRYLLENEIDGYAEVFMRAPECVADWLMDLLNQWDADEGKEKLFSGGHFSSIDLVSALIFIPCDKVAVFLQKSSEEPLPSWAKPLNRLPIEYTEFAGWTVTEDGKIKKLYEDQVTVLSICEKSEASDEFPLCDLKTICPSCGDAFSLLYDGKRKLVTCLQCACYEPIFMKQREGRIIWMGGESTEEREELEVSLQKEIEENSLDGPYGWNVSDERRLACFTVSEWPNITHSQIGGMPTPRGSEVYYPSCKICGKKMKFKAQFDMAELNAWEGIYYFFECEECGVTACNYNQT